MNRIRYRVRYSGYRGHSPEGWLRSDGHIREWSSIDAAHRVRNEWAASFPDVTYRVVAVRDDSPLKVWRFPDD